MTTQAFYFFSKSERCQFMKKELEVYIPKYLNTKDPSVNERKYYLILDWNFTTDIHIYESILKEFHVPYVKRLEDLPQDAGIYVGLYGADPLVLQSVKDKNIPIIEHMCPWVKLIEHEIKNVPHTHQLLFMVDKNHIVFKNYSSILPSDAVIVNDVDFIEQLQANRNNKPIYFVTYSTFRERDCRKVIDYVKQYFPDNDNFFSLKGLCSWSKNQGIFTEIEIKRSTMNLDEIWIICNSIQNRSVQSLINAVKEAQALPKIISDINDIPDDLPPTKNVGIIIAPIPYHKENSIIDRIRSLYPDRMSANA